jgi:hypothetical protein
MMWMTIREALLLGLMVGIIGGGLSRTISRRLWPVGVGSAIGIVVGGGEAYTSDVFLSFWQRVWDSLATMGGYSFGLWLAIVVSWMAAERAVRRRQLPETRPS